MSDGQSTDHDRITQDPRVMAGQTVLKGTRLPVALVLTHLAHTLDLNDLFAAYPELTREDVKAALAYAGALVEHHPAGLTAPPGPAAKSPEQFYGELTGRADIREILTRLAR